MEDFFPLNEQEIRNWLRAVGLSEDEIARISYSIDYHKKRLKTLAIQIESTLHPVTGNTKYLCGLPVRRTRKRGNRSDKLKVLIMSEETTNKSITNLRSLLSPIRRLPPEILTEIFRYCLSQGFIRPRVNEGPLLLIQVCNAWRNACLTNPLFWRSLQITNKHCNTLSTDEEQKNNMETFVHSWFSRAGTCPLSLAIDYDNMSNQFVKDTLTKFGDRWQHLRVKMAAKTCLYLYPDNDYSTLESLEIHTPEGLEYTQIVSLSNVLMKAHNLRRFVWHNEERHSSPIRMHWDNLTHLRLKTSVDIDQCLTIMSMLGPIEQLTFQDIRLSIPTLTYDIILPQLTSFVICAEYNVSSIFDQVTFPQLKELVLNLHSWPHSSIAGFLSRSRCPLESLNLYFPPIREEQLIECLESVQNTLKEITIQSENDLGFHCITDNTLDRLTDSGNGKVLCPRVAVIALYHCISCSPGRFAGMVQSRLPRSLGIDDRTSPERNCSPPTPKIVPIRVVELYDSEAELEFLKPLRRSGLVLKIYSSVDGTPMAMEPEELEHLKELKREGLVLRVYLPETGHFGEVD